MKIPTVSDQKVYLVVKVLALLTIFIWVVSLYHRFIHVDDGWLGEQAYWLAKDGKVRSMLFEGLNNYEVSQLVYHKLFIWQGAAVITVFGWNIYVLKAISLVYFGVFIFLVFRYLLSKDEFSVGQRWFALLLIFCAVSTVEYSFVFRPEIMLMTLGLASYLLLDAGHKQSRTSLIILSGIVAGVAVVTHLNGIIYGVAGVVTLLFLKRIKFVFLFGFFFGLTSLFYLANIHDLNDWNLFLSQFQGDPALNEKHFSFSHYLMKVPREHERFFHSATEVVLSVLLVLSIIFGWKRLNQYKHLGIYTVVLIIMLALLAHDRTAKYLLLQFPFFLLIMVVALPDFVKRFVFIPAFLTFVVVNIYFNIVLVRTNENIPEKHARIATAVGSHGKHIVAPIEFVFNEIEHSAIQSNAAFRFILRSQHDQKDFDFFEEAARFHNQIILAAEEDMKRMQIEVPEVGARRGQYVYKGMIEGLYHFERVQ